MLPGEIGMLWHTQSREKSLEHHIFTCRIWEEFTFLSRNDSQKIKDFRTVCLALKESFIH